MTAAIARFTWNAAYEVGDARIDAEHRGLFDLANELLGATQPEARADVTARLSHHVREHFAHEEAVMRQLAYTGYRRHAAVHDQLLGRLDALAQDILSGRLHEDALNHFMTEWLVGHILDEDSLLGAWITG